MTQVLLYLIVVATTGTALVQPWIGVVAYYVLAVLFPQSIWPWIFRDLRISLYVALSVIIGFIVALIAGRIKFGFLRTRQNALIGSLWLSFLISYYFNPYGANEAEVLAVNSKALFVHMNKVFLMYFIGTLVVDTSRKLRYLSLVLLVTAIVFTVWANYQYLSGQMPGFRLTGPAPRGSIYSDENSFAMILVVGTAFLINFGLHFQSIALRWSILCMVPFAWHAVFLTGSRGGLVGAAVVALVTGLQSGRRIVLGFLVAALTGAFLWQGGPYLLGRAGSIVNYEGEASAEGRIDAWKAGLKMMMDHPITGVGLGNFMDAFPHYSDKRVRVAHNTVVQFGAETGIPTALLYLAIFYNAFLRGRTTRKDFRTLGGLDHWLQTTHRAVEGGMYGFFVCALFLNLATYEVMYYLLIIHQSLKMVTSGKSERRVPMNVAGSLK